MEINRWKHDHTFFIGNKKGEKGVFIVMVLTAVTMIGEIAAGIIFGSMALLADGWHMGTHLFALSVTAFAYYYAKKHNNNPEFSFGTGKVGALGGFASSILLALAALAMFFEGTRRLISPQEIHYTQAAIVAVIGLIVNVVSAFLLHQDDGHGHSHNHTDHENHNHSHQGHDHNLKAAYLHVIADALTSVLAIFALLAGRFFGLAFLDPVIGMLGGFVILKWALNLLTDTAKILLDKSNIPEVKDDIIRDLESDGQTRVADFHIWPVGESRFSLIASVVTTGKKTPLDYKNQVSFDNRIVHTTIEVNYLCEKHSDKGEPREVCSACSS
ncbi:MAG: CDF family Co(II)/Ni(II) efflux transporter DmeF [Thermodesulfobacteriota bacterium]